MYNNEIGSHRIEVVERTTTLVCQESSWGLFSESKEYSIWWWWNVCKNHWIFWWLGKWFLYSPFSWLFPSVYAVDYSIFLLTNRSLLMAKSSDCSSIISILKSYPDVLWSCLTNALHTHYYHYYMCSLGLDRFCNLQLSIFNYLHLIIQNVDCLSLSTYAIQLCMLVLDPNAVLTRVFTFISQGLPLSWKKETIEKRAIPRNQDLMCSYFICLLLSVIYNHCIINHSRKDLIKERVLTDLCSADVTSIDAILDRLSSIESSEDVVCSLLQEIANSSYDRRIAAVVYSPKPEVFKQFSVFTGCHSLFKQNEMLDVLFSCFVLIL